MCLCVQDVDSAYLVKADLEDKVGALTDEINFLRNVYEEVLKRLHALNHRGYDLSKQSYVFLDLHTYLFPPFGICYLDYFPLQLLNLD